MSSEPDNDKKNQSLEEDNTSPEEQEYFTVFQLTNAPKKVFQVVDENVLRSYQEYLQSQEEEPETSNSNATSSPLTKKPLTKEEQQERKESRKAFFKKRVEFLKKEGRLDELEAWEQFSPPSSIPDPEVLSAIDAILTRASFRPTPHAEIESKIMSDEWDYEVFLNQLASEWYAEAGLRLEGGSSIFKPSKTGLPFPLDGSEFGQTFVEMYATAKQSDADSQKTKMEILSITESLKKAAFEFFGLEYQPRGQMPG